MVKETGNNKRTKILLACFIAVVLGMLVFIGFFFFDLGHKIEIMGYAKISSAEELQAIAGKPDGKYRLTGNIDMQGREWTPFTFNGVLDGDGHEISNLTVTSLGTAVRDTYDGNMKCYSTSLTGMFDVMEGAVVRNLTLSSVNVDVEADTPCFAGMLAGYMGDSKISNCNISGEVRLRAHDRMFGVGGVTGYGYGTLEHVDAHVTLVCVDTDRLTMDEQFMGGLVGAGYPDLISCNVNIDGYGSEHGYAHNGGAIGMYMFYPEGNVYPGRLTGNYIEGKITFFEDNEDRRAYCSGMIGEQMDNPAEFSENYASFQRVEVYNYDAELLPEERSETFEYKAAKQGYYDLEVQYVNEGTDATYGLFVNDRFCKKVYFPSGEGTVTETVFLEKGDNQVKFKFLPGDGNISFGDISFKESGKSVTLIVAPHQDDEVFGFAGTIQKTIAEGNIVKVLFLTNGDYFGADFTHIRMAESISALSLLGVDKSDITMLGYGDLSLEALLSCEDPDQVFQSRSGWSNTNGDSSQNLFDYHFLNTGVTADYSASDLRNDFREYILATRPDRIYTTSEFEWHTDHKYAFLLAKETLDAVTKETDYHPVLCSTAIHGESLDVDWPELLTFNSDGTPVITGFTDPFPSSANAPDWNNAVKITLTDEEVEKKRSAIGAFASQNEDCDLYDGTKEYNYSFCKRNEFYWEFSY